MRDLTTFFKKAVLAFLVFFFYSSSGWAQADCSSAVIVCGNTQPFNPSGVGTKLEQLACGGIEHNSIWIAFQAKANGKLNFVIRPFTPDGLPSASDFDWSLYALPGAPGTTNCDNKTSISCNFAGTSTVFGIPGGTGMATPNYTATQFNPGIDVVSGNWYALMIDQFSNSVPLLFSVQFTGNPESASLNSTPGIFDNRPDFTITNSSGCAGTFSFTNTATSVNGIASYLWNFGDGSTSTAASPTHTYATTGTYYATLTVTDGNGCKADIRKQLVYNVTPPTVNTAGILLLPSCSDSNNGSITITTTGATTPGVTGGTPPYTYELVSPSAMIRTSQASNTFTGLQPGGYTIKVTDACGRSATNTVTISQVATNSNIGLGIQNIQSSCGNTPTGTATLFANGTAPPYTMALVNSSPVLAGPQPTLQRDPITSTYYGTFTNLLPGVYTLEATDACGKIRRATFTVTQSTAPVANSVTSASCAGTATGTITVTSTAATGLSGNGAPGTFQFALIAPSTISRPFQNSSVFENLLPGPYTVAVRDNCGNIGTSNVTVATAAAPTFGTAFVTPSCPNGATGTIEAQISTAGGGSPYTFELIAPSPALRPAQNSNAFTALPPGAYTIRMTDACGTQVNATVNVGAATAPSFTTTIVNSCGATANGSVTVAPAATSIGPFTFELISPGAAIRAPQGSNIANTSNSIFTGLNQGSYTIRMTDGCGVPVTGVVTVAGPTALAFPAGSTTIASCAAGSTGQITVAVPTTGSAPYSYELIAPSTLVVAPQSSRIFNNLPVGSYTVQITDACGTQVTIGAPLAVVAATAPTLSVTNTSSCASNTGTITATATTANQGGGTYLFALIAPSPVVRPDQASPIFTGLPAGAYTVQITDQCGVTGTTTTTITAAGAFTPAAGGSIVACNGAGYYGQIIVTSPQNYTTGGPIPTGSGGGPYTFAIYDSTNTTLIAGPQSSNIFSTIAPLAGTPTHTVRVTDICGNTSTTTVTINAPAAMTNATISATTASCASSNTGVIKVTTAATGGLAPYTYTLIDAVSTAVVAGPQTATTFNLVPASATGYFVRSTDACGNSTTTAVALLFPAAVTPTATTATIASCAASSTGRITVTPGTGATMAGGAFTYALYDAANVVLVVGPQASPVFNNVAAATYTVRITDRCGTTGTATATVASGVAAPTASGVATNTCTGSTNGVITASSTGGSLPITYSLVDQTTSLVIAGPQSNNVFNNLAVGTYIVRVTDACGSVTDSANIPLGNLAATPTITTSVAIDCAGSAVIAGFGGGGNGGPYTYAMCNGAGCSTFSGYSTTSTFTVFASGTYRISVLDRCGNATTSTDIVVVIPIKAVLTGVTLDSPCGATTITPSYTNVPNTPYYSIDGGNFSPTIGTLAAGTHTIVVTDYNAGTFGCASDVFTFTINNPPSAPTASDQNFCSGANPTVANLTATGVGTINWYNVPVGGTALLSTDALVATTYYASQTVGGCEGPRVAINVTITASTSNSTTTSACDSFTWGVNGTTYTSSGTYTSVTGCHTETLNLTIVTSSSNSTTLSACDSYTWAVNGTTYTTSGVYTSVSGCHTETLNLTIVTSTSNSTTLSACDSYTWAVNGTTYTSSGTYTSVTGCHTETLNLTIVTSTSNSTTLSACDSYTWSVNGATYTSSGVYTSVTGCHTETLNLTIVTSTSNSTTIAACNSYTWAVNGTTYTSSGTYTFVSGCHTETLNLTIDTVDTTITNSNNVLTVAEAGASYQWYTCDGGGVYTAIVGATSQSYTVTAIGDYAVDVIENSCNVRSACFNVAVLGTDTWNSANSLTVFPNPSTGIFNIQMTVDAKAEIFDITGKQILSKTIFAGTSTLDLSAYRSGMYLIRITDENNNSQTVKVIKN
nr:PKD domain-containing protein [uncultured Flavobacterium sp.]